MIPVGPKPEPAEFDQQVREPGKLFLEEVPHPTDKQWKSRAYWRRTLPDMRKAYGGICAYSAIWIPYSTGNHSIDHFMPKSQHPTLAYEWQNFRYVAARFNGRKGTRSILDPFELQPDWFVLDFTSFLILANSTLTTAQKVSVNETIEILKLNIDEDLVLERQSWVQEYQDDEISFDHLKKKAPFIAYELERQNLR